MLGLWPWVVMLAGAVFDKGLAAVRGVGRLVAGLVGRGSCSTEPTDGARTKEPLIAFSFAGMLWAYFIGVVAFLRDHYNLEASQVRLSGISCGCAAAMAIFLDLSIEQAFDLGLGWQELFDSRPMKFWLLRTSTAMSMIMDKYRTYGISDAVLRDKYTRWKEIYFGVTVVEAQWRSWVPRFRVRHECLGEFGGFKEMTYAGTCSMRTLPFFRAPGFFRNKFCVDGALTGCYAVPRHYAANYDRVIRIGIVNLPLDAPADVAPESNFSFAWHEWCNSGGLDDNLRRFEMGYRDAASAKSVISCVKKGLKWTYCASEDIISATASPAWSAHVDSRIRHWRDRLSAHFS